MIEAIVLDYLSDVLDVPIFMEMPTDEERKKGKINDFVLLEKTGGSRDNFVKSATFAIQSYADSLANSAMLNEKVKNAMDKITILDNVSKSKLNTDYDFKDITKKQYRYQAIYDLVYFD